MAVKNVQNAQCLKTLKNEVLGDPSPRSSINPYGCAHSIDRIWYGPGRNLLPLQLHYVADSRVYGEMFKIIKKKKLKNDDFSQHECVDKCISVNTFCFLGSATSRIRDKFKQRK